MDALARRSGARIAASIDAGRRRPVGLLLPDTLASPPRAVRRLPTPAGIRSMNKTPSLVIGGRKARRRPGHPAGHRPRARRGLRRVPERLPAQLDEAVAAGARVRAVAAQLLRGTPRPAGGDRRAHRTERARARRDHRPRAGAKRSRSRTWRSAARSAWTRATAALELPVEVIEDRRASASSCTAARSAWWDRSRRGTGR